MIGGIEDSVRAIKSAIHDALDRAGPLPCSVDQAVISVAGVSDDVVRSQLADRVNASDFASRSIVVPDYAPILAATRATGPCVGVIAGTGSVAFCRDSQGQVHRHGGWGPLLADEGSGFSIGKRAINAALYEFEAQTTATPLTRIVLDAVSGKDARDLLRLIYQSDDPRRVVASVARDVIRAANTEHAAQEMLGAEMASLAQVVSRSFAAVDHGGKPLPLGLGGGVLANSPLAQSLLLSELRALGRQVEQVTVLREPAAGCLLLATVGST